MKNRTLFPQTPGGAPAGWIMDISSATPASWSGGLPVMKPTWNCSCRVMIWCLLDAQHVERPLRRVSNSWFGLVDRGCSTMRGRRMKSSIRNIKPKKISRRPKPPEGSRSNFSGRSTRKSERGSLTWTMDRASKNGTTKSPNCGWKSSRRNNNSWTRWNGSSSAIKIRNWITISVTNRSSSSSWEILRKAMSRSRRMMSLKFK